LSALSGNVSLLLAHPRARLYLSLLVLLGDEPVDVAKASRIFAAHSSDLEGVEQRFFQLQRRFS
jgi:hypothetical protein